MLSYLFIFFVGVFLGHKGIKKAKSRSASRTYSYKNRPYQRTYPKKAHLELVEDRDNLFWRMMRQGVFLKKKRSGYLLTETENHYRNKLESWFGKYCDIHSQVSLGQLIEFANSHDFTEEECRRFFTIYNAMAMDYVIVSKKTHKIICVIELNDASHDDPKRKERDKKLTALMSESNIFFIMVSVNDMTEPPDIWMNHRKGALNYN